MKIVVNKCYGGFGLSEKAKKYLADRNADIVNIEYGYDYELRNDPKLVECVERLGKEASDLFSLLVVVEIPDNIKWRIVDDDGYETVHEEHRVW